MPVCLHRLNEGWHAITALLGRTAEISDSVVGTLGFEPTTGGLKGSYRSEAPEIAHSESAGQELELGLAYAWSRL